MKTFEGKYKAITFSFDDGVTQDIRLIEILNKKMISGLNDVFYGTNSQVFLK